MINTSTFKYKCCPGSYLSNFTDNFYKRKICSNQKRKGKKIYVKIESQKKNMTIDTKDKYL